MAALRGDETRVTFSALVAIALALLLVFTLFLVRGMADGGEPAQALDESARLFGSLRASLLALEALAALLLLLETWLRGSGSATAEK